MGLTWNFVRAQWDADEQRLVAALECDGDMATKHAHVLDALAQFRSRKGRWPDAFAKDDRRSAARTSTRLAWQLTSEGWRRRMPGSC